MIAFEHVSVQYAGAPAPSLHDVTLEIPEGELVLVVGPTGSGIRGPPAAMWMWRRC